MDPDHDLPQLPTTHLNQPVAGTMPVSVPMPEPSPVSFNQSEDNPSSSEHSSRRKGRKGKEKEYIPTNVRDLAKLLAYEQRETKELHRMLFVLTEQLEVERQRANDAERRLTEALERLKSVNDARAIAIRDYAYANEQIKLYKIQLEAAQKEIFRAQEILDSVDRRRYEAEKDAARSRTAVRRMNEEMLVWNAREQGRRVGIKEGLERGRDIGFREAKHSRSRRRDTYTTVTTDFSTTTDGGDFYYERGYDSAGDVTPPEEEEPQPLGYYKTTSSERSPRPIEVPPPLPPAPPTGATFTNAAPSPAPITATRSLTPEYRPSLDSIAKAPTIIHTVPPSPNHIHVAIPPDNWIPSTGRDSVIRLPPPHELSRPPPTPRRTPSPALPKAADADIPPLIVPAPDYRHSYRNIAPPEPIIVNMMHNQHSSHRQASPVSSHASTNISQFDMVNDVPLLYHRRSPLSDIAEVLSVHTGSPNPAPLPSVSPFHSTLSPSIHVTPAPEPDNGKYTRSRSPGSSSGSRKSKTVNGSQLLKDRRGSYSSINTIPDITIQPPSRPPSNGSTTLLQMSSPKSPRATRSMGNLLSPADAHRQLAPSPPVQSIPQYTGVSIEEVAAVPKPPTPYEPVAAQFYPTPDSPRDRPVIPDPSLYRLSSDGTSSDSGTSGFSGNTLTTPPGRKLKLASSIGGFPGITAAGVPLPDSTIGTTTPRSMGMFTLKSSRSKESKKGSLSSLSRSVRG